VNLSTTYLEPVVVPLIVALLPLNAERPVGLMVKLRTTATAATWLVVSPCVAVNEHVPDDNMVTAIPDTEQTEGVVDDTDGVMFDVADTSTLKGVADHDRAMGFVNKMVFAARAMVTV
jgi:hypothetical protein